MSTVAIAWAWKQTHLKPNQKYLLIACAEFAGMRGEGIYPGVERLAAMTGYSDRQVTRVLAELVDAGSLIVVQKGGWPKGGKPQATEYNMPVYPARKVGDVSSPTPPTGGGQIVQESVTDCPKLGDEVSPQPRTTTKNMNQEPKEATAQPTPDDLMSADASRIVKAWWDSFTPKPSGSWIGARQLALSALKAGWSPDAVSAALTRIKEPVFNRRALEASLRSGAGRTIHSSTATEPSVEIIEGGTNW